MLQEDVAAPWGARWFLLAGGALLIGGQFLRRLFEHPSYDVTLRSGRFEIRDYNPRIVAETWVDGLDRRRSTDEGFARLARYIFGGNQAKPQKPSRLSMTVPVETQNQTNGAWLVAFTMPRKYALSDLPQPNDPRVHLRERPAEKTAVLRFSGRVDNTDIATHESELLRLAQEKGYTPKGPVTVAVYDPPSWVLPMFRRNELMVPVERL